MPAIKYRQSPESEWVTITPGASSFNNRYGNVMPESGDYTADMVGADPAGSANAVQENLDSAVTTINQSLSEKAPAGYGGYGEIIPKGGTFTDEESFVAWLTAKINALPFGASEQVRFALFYGHFSGGDWYGTLTNESGYGTLSVMSYGGISYGGHFTHMTRTVYNYAWDPWEYVNPPMIPGKEYRTTERYNGKPVYVQLFNFGALPNNTTNRQILTIGNHADDPFFCTGVAEDPTGVLPSFSLPSFVHYDDIGAPVEQNVKLSTARNVVCVKTDWDASAFGATVLVKYTKD